MADARACLQDSGLSSPCPTVPVRLLLRSARRRWMCGALEGLRGKAWCVLKVQLRVLRNVVPLVVVQVEEELRVAVCQVVSWS